MPIGMAIGIALKYVVHAIHGILLKSFFKPNLEGQVIERQRLGLKVRCMGEVQPFTANSHAARKRVWARVRRLTVVAPAVSARNANSSRYSLTWCSVCDLWMRPTRMAFSSLYFFFLSNKS